MERKGNRKGREGQEVSDRSLSQGQGSPIGEITTTLRPLQTMSPFSENYLEFLRKEML